MLISSLNFAIQAVVKAEDTGRAASTDVFMRTLGTSIGIPIGGTIFQNLTARRFREVGLPKELAKNAEGYISQLGKLSSSQFSKVEQAYIDSFKGVWVTLTGIAGLGLFASLFIKHPQHGCHPDVSVQGPQMKLLFLLFFQQVRSLIGLPGHDSWQTYTMNTTTGNKLAFVAGRCSMHNYSYAHASGTAILSWPFQPRAMQGGRRLHVLSAPANEE